MNLELIDPLPRTIPWPRRLDSRLIYLINNEISVRFPDLQESSSHAYDDGFDAPFPVQRDPKGVLTLRTLAHSYPQPND